MAVIVIVVGVIVVLLVINAVRVYNDEPGVKWRRWQREEPKRKALEKQEREEWRRARNAGASTGYAAEIEAIAKLKQIPPERWRGPSKPEPYQHVYTVSTEKGAAVTLEHWWFGDNRDRFEVVIDGKLAVVSCATDGTVVWKALQELHLALYNYWEKPQWEADVRLRQERAQAEEKRRRAKEEEAERSHRDTLNKL